MLLLQEPVPGGRQRQQPQRVPGRRGVEDHVVEVGRRAGVRPADGRTRRRRRSRGCRSRRTAPPCSPRPRRAARRGTGRPSSRGRPWPPPPGRCSSPTGSARRGRRSARCRASRRAPRRGCDAGSVLTSSTRFPASASVTAVAQASEVLPTPPLPVKNSPRVGSFRNSMTHLLSGVRRVSSSRSGRSTTRSRVRSRSAASAATPRTSAASI